MRTRRILGMLAAGVALLLTVTPVLAVDTTVYRGVFSGDVTYVGCDPSASDGVATGTWSIVDMGDVATLHVAIKTNGKPHVSFGGRFPTYTESGASVGVPVQLTDVIYLRVKVVGDSLDYTIQPYDMFGLKCDSVTYHGTVLGVTH